MFSGMHFSCLAQSLFFKVFDYKLRKKVLQHLSVCYYLSFCHEILGRL